MLGQLQIVKGINAAITELASRVLRISSAVRQILQGHAITSVP
mgnify:CR=1 FL=1